MHDCKGKRQRKVFERYLRVLLETKPTQKQYGSELEKHMSDVQFTLFLTACSSNTSCVKDSNLVYLRLGNARKSYAEDSSFDLDEFWIQCKMNDLKPFAESMSRLANYVCGVKDPWLVEL
jgi:hypothetical protein